MENVASHHVVRIPQLEVGSDLFWEVWTDGAEHNVRESMIGQEFSAIGVRRVILGDKDVMRTKRPAEPLERSAGHVYVNRRRRLSCSVWHRFGTSRAQSVDDIGCAAMRLLTSSSSSSVEDTAFSDVSVDWCAKGPRASAEMGMAEPSQTNNCTICESKKLNV